MTKRDFFRILIKVFGLYSLILTVFYFFPANISYVTFEIRPINFLWVFIAVLIPILIYILLIRKADVIIDALKIDKGFDSENIELGNFNSEKLIYLALIIIGAFLIIDNLSIFLQYTYLAFKKEVTARGLNFMEEMNFGDSIDYFNWAFSGMNIILGYIILTNYVRITKWLNRNANNNNDE